jgi:hypothetical protein
MNFELKYLIGNILVTGHFVNLPFRHLTKNAFNEWKELNSSKGSLGGMKWGELSDLSMKVKSGKVK